MNSVREAFETWFMANMNCDRALESQIKFNKQNNHYFVVNPDELEPCYAMVNRQNNQLNRFWQIWQDRGPLGSMDKSDNESHTIVEAHLFDLTASMQEEIDQLQEDNSILRTVVHEKGKSAKPFFEQLKEFQSSCIMLRSDNKQLQAEVEALKEDRRDLAEILDKALGKLCGHKPPKTQE